MHQPPHIHQGLSLCRVLFQELPLLSAEREVRVEPPTRSTRSISVGLNPESESACLTGPMVLSTRSEMAVQTGTGSGQYQGTWALMSRL